MMPTDAAPLTAQHLKDRQARLIVDNAVDYAIVGLDLQGIITSWNEGARQIMGWSEADAIGHHVELFFTDEDRAARIAAAEMSAAVRHGRGVDERWHLRQSGERFWANGEMMPLKGEGGALEGYVKILRDRTEQHNAVEALSQSQERYRSLYDAIDEGFCLIEVRCDDRAQPIDYRFVEVNPAFERQTGLTDVPGHWMRDLAPNHEQHWFDTYARVALTGEPARFTLPAQALDSRWYEVFAYRMGDPVDRLVAVLFSDISERRSRQARLETSEQHLRELNISLRASETNLRLLLDTIHEGFYAIDRDGVTTTCNAAFLKMMGFAQAEDAIGRKLHDVIHHSHPDGSHYPVVDCPIYTAASIGVAQHVAQEQFFPIEGPPVWAEYWATPIVENGELKGAICTFQDITERLEREQSHHDAERRRGVLLDLGDKLRSMDDLGAMAGVAAKLVGEVLGVSAVGFGRIDATDETLFIDEAWALADAGNIAGGHPMREYGSYIDDLKRGSIVVIPDVRDDERTRASAASFEAVGVRALVNAPLVEKGRLAAILCVLAPTPRSWSDDEVEFIRDAAERIRAAIERRRAEHKLQALASTLEQQVEDRTQERDRIWDVSRDLLGVCDTQGVWQSVSPAWEAILGWPQKAFTGRTLEWLLHPADKQKTLAELANVVAGGASQGFEIRVRDRSGTYHDLSWTAVPASGAIYCVGRDVTDQKQRDLALSAAEDQLRQSQKVEAVGQLTGGVAHDFNNLLTVIRGSVDLLRRPGLSDEKRERYVAAIADTADRATRLTSQLLAFARRQTLRTETFDAAFNVQALRDMLGTLAGSRIVIDVEVAGEPVLVKADRSQFDTALVNMAVNARDAMKGEGTISISVKPVSGMPALRSHPAIPGEFIALSVCDTGIGIAPGQIDRIFEPFYTTKGVGHGTGLGLSQVFGFAKQSGGDVLVESRVGEGATFTLYLPMAVEHVKPQQDIIGAGLAVIGSGACILVVEDNAEVGSFATSALSELGYRTTLAIDAASALVELGPDGHGFDAVFSDVVMPGMSGIELGQEIRKRFPLLPVILTSGYSSVLAQDGTHGFELLQKPYSLDELSSALSKVASWRQSDG